MDNEERSGTPDGTNEVNQGKVILLHGFDHSEMSAILKAVKSAVADPQDIAFAMSTPTNLAWRFRDIIEDVRGDHEYLKENPPGRQPPGK